MPRHRRNPLKENPVQDISNLTTDPPPADLTPDTEPVLQPAAA
jgi:hypothetical protein